MSSHTLRCRVTAGDYAEAHIDGDGDVRLELHMGAYTSAFLYARPAEFAAFARAVLAGTGESVETLTDGSVKVGDLVEITKDRDWTSEDVGRRGLLTQIDEDDSLRYRVKLDDGGEVWFMEVRKVATSSRADLVTRARSALEGTNPTAADIIRLAEFLAG
jgi:hypothetical protein